MARSPFRLKRPKYNYPPTPDSVIKRLTRLDRAALLTMGETALMDAQQFLSAYRTSSDEEQAEVILEWYRSHAFTAMAVAQELIYRQEETESLTG